MTSPPEIELPPSPQPPLDAAKWTAPPAKPRVWPVFTAFIVLLPTIIATSAVIEIVAVLIVNHGTLGDPRDLGKEVLRVATSSPTFFIILFVTSLIQVAAAGLAAIFSPVPWRQRLCLRKAALGPIGFVVVALGALAISEMSSAVFSLLHLDRSGSLEMIRTALSDLSPTGLILAIITVGIVPGFAEELFFRGYSQSRLVSRFGPVWGILVTSLLFAIIHMDPVHSCFAFVFGIYLGYVALRTGSILPTIFCHAVNNTVSVFGAAYGAEPDSITSTVIVGVIATVVLILCLWYLRRRGPTGGLHIIPA